MQTIDAMLKNSCRKFPYRPALRHKVAGVWHETTYRNLDTMSDRIAAGLRYVGLDRSQKAAILAPSSPRWVAAYFGILKAGGIVVPIDKELKKGELRHILSDCDARIIFIDRQYLELLEEIQENLPLLDRIVLLDSPAQNNACSPAADQALHELAQEWQKLVSSMAIPKEKTARLESIANDVLHLLAGTGGTHIAKNMDELSFPIGVDRHPNPAMKDRLMPLESLSRHEDTPTSLHTPADTALILYTSGTTGRSKGAMLSHGNVVSNIRAMVGHFNLDSSIHTLSFLPINHVFEQVCGILTPLSLGGTVSFAESLKKLGENLFEVKPTFFLGVPAVYRLILDRIMKNIQRKTIPKFLYSLTITRPIVVSRIRKMFGEDATFISGGAALDPSIARNFRTLGLKIYQGYGITETSPVISAERPDRTRLGTVGHILKDVQVRIDRPSHEGVGEILVKGPNIMQGYYKNAQATDEALAGGWYHTGDLGRVDEDGFLSICGRVKNLIVTPNGKNVYPEEVEIELLKSPYIEEVMVYGHKMDSTVEEVHAIIYPCQEALDDHNRKNLTEPVTEADVEALIREQVHAACRNLADYKRVKKFTLREDEFPKTTTRKIKRFVVEADIPA